jgi:outer membrane immunogenic protein
MTEFVFRAVSGILLGWLIVLGFTLASASAGDLSVWSANQAPPPITPAPVGTNWSGCYAGVEGGGVWGHSTHTQNDPFVVTANSTFGLPLTNNFSTSGGLLGGTLGCNYQVGNWVLGIEDDMSWTDQNGTATVIPPFNPNATVQTSSSWLGTFRGRLGYAWGSWYLYGTVGAAIANEGSVACSVVVGCVSQNLDAVGWAAGAGVEYMLWGGPWSVKFEYLHTDFGSQSFTRAPIANGFFDAHKVSLNDDIFRVGVNYKFGWFVFR